MRRAPRSPGIRPSADEEPMTRTRLSFAALLPLALLACAERTDPDPTPLEDRGAYNLIDPVNVEDAAGPVGLTTLGNWQTGTVDDARAVLFARPQAEPVFAIFCDGRRGLVLERRGLTPGGALERMDVAIAGVRRTLAVNPVIGDGPPVLRAVVPYNDELQVRLQDRAAPMSVDVGEDEALRLPASPLIPALATECARALS